MATTSWPDLLGISENNRHNVGRVDADDGQICVGIVAHEVGPGSPAIGERDVDTRGAMDDVAVGQNEPVGSEEEARPAAACFPASETAVCFDIDDGGADSLGSADDRA